jgi:ADP-L-glycero-D-manno-heptose 6-epimerase
MSSTPLLLVTGAAGFIGARFVSSCTRRGYAVISVDTQAFFQSRPEHGGIDFGEVVDRRTLFDWLDRRLPLSGIVHLGACTDTTELDMAYLQALNVRYSQDLWLVAVERQVPFVYASSAATYGDGSLGYGDDEALLSQLKPLNPYGQSKQDVDLWILQQDRMGQVPPAWSGFKFFNVYGFGERHKGKMASVALHAYDQIRATGRVHLFKSHRPDIPHGHQKRDFIHVDDVVAALHFALEKPIRRGIFNLGTGRARTFLDLARGVFRELGCPDRIEFIDTPAELQPRYQYFTEARMERLRQEGHTAPFTSLEDGIRTYVRDLLAFSSEGVHR